MGDVISVTGLQLRTSLLERDLWQRVQQEQPLTVSLTVETKIDAEADSDALLANSLNYGSITKAIERCVHRDLPAENEPGAEFPLEVLADRIAAVVLFDCHAPNVQLSLERPRALLTAQTVGVSIRRDRADYDPDSRQLHDLNSGNLLNDRFYVKQLSRLIIIGLNPGERLDEQQVLVDIEVKHPALPPSSPDMPPYSSPHALARPGWRGWRGAIKRVEEHLSASKPLTIEHLVVSLASVLLTPHTSPAHASASPSATPALEWDVTEATVRCSKPSALMFAQYPTVGVTRRRDHFPHLRHLAVPAGQRGPGAVRALSTATASSAPAKAAAATAPGTAKSTQPARETPESMSLPLQTAFIGLGTNLGARPGNLNDAVTRLDALLRGGEGEGRTEGGKDAGRVVETSWMYESEAMYHEEQDKFLNAAIKIETTLSPLRLLTVLKAVERDLGRDFGTFRNGPRVIDLDLLLYGDVAFDSRKEQDHAAKTKEEKEEGRWWLRVPHASLQEREFVLRPLHDLAADLVHPVLKRSIGSLLADLVSEPTFRSTVQRVFPLSRTRVQPYSRPALSPVHGGASPALASNAAAADSKRHTLVMSILNMTPDSFSDGSAERVGSVQAALEEVERHVRDGAEVIDVGGMSTRPGAANIDPEEEVNRVVPLIEAIRAQEQSASSSAAAAPLVVSVDTFRPRVAEAAIRAGADVINDVYGGREPGMLQTMADLACPVVLMHSRGNPSTMTSLTDYSEQGGVPGVRREMQEMLERALRAGVRRWNVILDPGFGFAKTGKQNLVLLRHLDDLFQGGDHPTLRDYPVLIGLSRKKFLNPDKKVAAERQVETVAALACAVRSGYCEVARVHDTRDAKEVLAFVDRVLDSADER